MKALIIGLGWLGLPLASFLKQQNYSVAGTVRSAEKADRMRGLDYQCYPFNLFEMQTTHIEPSAIKGSKVVINIAPGRKTIDASAYTTGLQALIDYLIQHGAVHIIFVSTTSVFGNQPGRVYESTEPSPLTQSGIAHAQIESYLLNQHAQYSSVLRLAGLIGPNIDGSLRHPVFSLIKREKLDAGQQQVNLVHQADVIALIYAIMQQGKTNEIFHACATEHPSRYDYYTWCAHTLGLDAPKFSAKTTQSNYSDSKVVDCERSLKVLKHQLLYPSPYDMLAHRSTIY